MAKFPSKATADREVLPKLVQIGEPIFIEKNGKWYRTDDGKEVNIITASLKELMIILGIE
jgi:hypothetical protein